MPIYTIRTIQDGKTIQRKQVTQGLGRDPVAIQAHPDAFYLLADTLYNKGPTQIVAKRVGKNLLLALDGGSADVPDIIIEGYFAFPPAPIEGALGSSEHQPYNLGTLLPSVADVGTAAAPSAAASTTSEPVQAKLKEGIWDNNYALLGTGLGILALAGGAAGGGSSSGASALDVIRTYADDGSKAAPTLVNYTGAGVKGVTTTNLVSINSAVDVLKASDVNSVAKLQSVVDAYKRILGEASSTSGSSTVTKASASDFATIGADIGQSQSNSNGLGLLGSAIINLNSTQSVSVSTINELAAVVDKVMAIAAGQNTAALTVNDLAILGILTSGSGAVTAANLTAVQHAIAGAGGQNKVGTFADLNTLVVAVATIYNYANDGSQAVPTTAQYSAMGVTGVTDSNLTAINSAVDASTGAGVDAKAKVQAIVDAYNTILTDSKPTAGDYATIGADIGQSQSNANVLGLLNSVVGNLTNAQIDSVSKINALAAAVDKVMAIAAGQNTASLTVNDLATLGILTSGSGAVTAANLTAVQHAIAGAGGQNEVGTFADLNTLVVAVATIYNYANDVSQAVPTTAQYSAMGVTGVTESNLTAINSAVDASTGAGVDSKAKVQAIVNAYASILAEANGTSTDVTPGVNPTADQYALIGANIGQAAVDANNLALLNDVIANLRSNQVDSIQKINSLAIAVNKVMAGVNGQANLTVSDLALLGMPTGAGAVTADNLAAINNAISTAGSITKVDSYAELSALVTTATSIYNFADDGTQTAPTLAQYTNLGITGVTSANLDAINSAVSTKTGTGVDSKSELQAIVDAYNAILAEANGSLADATPGVNPTAAQFALIGANIGDAATHAANLNLLDDAIAGLASTAVNSIAQINDLAAAANAVISGAAGISAPTMAQLSLLGITGVTVNTTLAVQNAIAATVDNGLQVDTIAELQNLVTTAVNAAVSSQTIIKNYANDEVNTLPDLVDYTNIGVHGVVADNLAAINSAVDALVGTNVSSPYQVQTVVDSYNKILNVADGIAGGINANIAPTAQDFANIGTSVGLSIGGTIGGADLASAALNLLDEAIAGKNRVDVDQVNEINTIATAVDHVMNLAKLPTGSSTASAQLSMNELTLLGVDTHLVDTSQETDAILQAIIDSGDSGSGVNTLLALQTVVNAHAS